MWVAKCVQLLIRAIARVLQVEVRLARPQAERTTVTPVPRPRPLDGSILASAVSHPSIGTATDIDIDPAPAPPLPTHRWTRRGVPRHRSVSR
jgi:hypothetical protein